MGAGTAACVASSMPGARSCRRPLPPLLPPSADALPDPVLATLPRPLPLPQALPYSWTLFYVPMHFLTHEMLLFFTSIWTTNIHDNIHAKARLCA